VILMAHGLPVIGTIHNPPDPDLVSEPAVRLVAPRDVGGLVHALRDLLADPAARHRLRTSACAFTRGFTWPATAQRHVGIYQALL
jgi:glycosyltransferase involved in cell wall biosynthesis